MPTPPPWKTTSWTCGKRTSTKCFSGPTSRT